MKVESSHHFETPAESVQKNLELSWTNLCQVRVEAVDNKQILLLQNKVPAPLTSP